MRSEKEIRSYVRDAEEVLRATQVELEGMENPLQRLLCETQMLPFVASTRTGLCALKWALGEESDDNNRAIENSAKVAALLRSGKTLKEIHKELSRNG